MWRRYFNDKSLHAEKRIRIYRGDPPTRPIATVAPAKSCARRRGLAATDQNLPLPALSRSRSIFNNY